MHFEGVSYRCMEEFRRATYVALWEYEMVPVEDATALAVETGVTVMVE